MLETFWTKAWSIWTAGGWVMIPLLFLSLCIYFNAVRLACHLSRQQFRRLPETSWRTWVRNPSEAQGEVGDMIRYTQDGARSLSEVHTRFMEIVSSILNPIDRRLQFLGTLVAAAPLVGLLGTVMGMLATFRALAAGGGGHVTDQMAAGISQALFPPEVGLCIAVPGLMLVHLLRRKRNETEAFLAQLESSTVQHMKHRPAEKRASHAPAPSAAELAPVEA